MQQLQANRGECCYFHVEGILFRDCLQCVRGKVGMGKLRITQLLARAAIECEIFISMFITPVSSQPPTIVRSLD